MKIHFRIHALVLVVNLLELALFPMQDYLTNVWKLSFTHAAAILNIWAGTQKLWGLFSLTLADAGVGYLMMLRLSNVAYTVGIGMVTASTPPVSNRSCRRYEAECIGGTQKALLYTGMALLAMGMGGQRPLLYTILQQLSKFGFLQNNMLFISVSLITAAAFFAFPYIKQWYILFGVVGICCTLLAIVVLIGRFNYIYDLPEGNPFTDAFRVFVAAARKISLKFPDQKSDYYGASVAEVSPTRFLRCLEKASILSPDQSEEEQMRNRWKLCTVEEVESAKFLVRLIPMGLTFVICTLVSSVGNTYLVVQASHLSRKLGNWKIPSQVLLALFLAGKEQLFNPLAYRLVRSSTRYRSVVGVAVAMTFSVLCCVSAAVIEVKRLGVVRRHGLVDKPDKNIPMTAFWLFFPFLMLAGLDSFFNKSVEAFYQEKSPAAFKRYCGHFAEVASGVGYMCSVLLVYVVGRITGRGDRQSWFQHTLNRSRLDLYYWLLAVASAVNVLIFILVALTFKYRDTKVIDDEVDIDD